MSALPPIADMCGAQANVRFVPMADIRCQLIAVSAAGQTQSNFKTYPSASSAAGVSGVGAIEAARAPACDGVAMRQFKSIPNSQDIVHPTCAICDAPMWLTRIEPDFPHHEKRTFECKACGGTTTVIVKFG